MAFHTSCYEAMTGRSTTRSKPSTKNNPDTGKPYVCQHCQKPIEIGQMFTWLPNARPGNYPRPAAHQPSPTVSEPAAVVVNSAMPVANSAILKETEVSEMFTFNPKVLAEALVPYLEGKFSPVANKPGETVRRIVVEHVVQEGPPHIEDLGLQHKSFTEVVSYIQLGLNVWIAGPAGSGKTTGCINAAKATGRTFYYTGAINDAFGLMGFIDAHGKYQETPFFKAYTQGGLFLWDEVDACDSNAVLAFQAALENGHCAFPHGIFERHKDFVCVAAANTWGLGANADYVGRNRLDAAFLDRFVMIDWDYDEGLELATAPVPAWTKFVQAIRAKVKEKGIRVLVTPRASYQGGKALKAGLPLDSVVRSTLQKCMTKEQWSSVKPTVMPEVINAAPAR